MQKSKSKKFDLQSRLANIRKFAEKNHTRDKFRDDYLLRLYRVLRHYRGFGEHKKFQKALLALAKEQKISRKYSRAERLLIELTAPQITTYHKSRLALLLGVLLKKNSPSTHVNMVLSEFGGADKAYRDAARKGRKRKISAGAARKVSVRKPAENESDGW